MERHQLAAGTKPEPPSARVVNNSSRRRRCADAARAAPVARSAIEPGPRRSFSGTDQAPNCLSRDYQFTCDSSPRHALELVVTGPVQVRPRGAARIAALDLDAVHRRAAPPRGNLRLPQRHPPQQMTAPVVDRFPGARPPADMARILVVADFRVAVLLRNTVQLHVNHARASRPTFNTPAGGYLRRIVEEVGRRATRMSAHRYRVSRSARDAADPTPHPWS